MLARCMLCGQFMAGKSIIQIARFRCAISPMESILEGLRAWMAFSNLLTPANGVDFVVYVILYCIS